uniref:Uncharacterized protein n=1 Tax=Arundo donax TaxID=35708 RepID=A0A0A9HL76_ARUDO
MGQIILKSGTKGTWYFDMPSKEFKSSTR